MPLTRLLRLRCADLVAEIRTDAPEALAGLVRRLRSVPRARRRPDLRCDALFRPRRLRLVVDGRSAGRASRRVELGPLLETRLYRELTQRSARAPIHAASLAREGGAVLVVGASGAGKSTIAWELARRGATYLGDEHAFLGPDGSVAGIPRAPSFEREGQVRLAWPERSSGQPAPVLLTVFLDPGAAQPRALAGSELLARLSSSLHRQPRPSDLRALSGLATRPGWILPRLDPTRLAAQIEGLAWGGEA